MKLSVIIPAWKAESTLPRCLASVRRSVEAAGKEAATCETVVVQDVSPVGRARNEGMRRATGDYLVWVDADDEVEEVWWREISTALADRPDALVFDCTLVWPDGRRQMNPWGRNGKITSRRLLTDMLRGIRLQSWLFTKVLRRELFDGLRFDEDVRLMEDFLLLPHVVRRVNSVRYLPRSLYLYRQRESSLTHLVNARVRRTGFELACRRAAEINAPLAAVECACMMAFSAIAADALFGADDSSAAIGYVRRHAVRTLLDTELPLTWKVKFLVCALGRGAVRSFAKMRGWNVHGGLPLSSAGEERTKP